MYSFIVINSWYFSVLQDIAFEAVKPKAIATVTTVKVKHDNCILSLFRSNCECVCA